VPEEGQWRSDEVEGFTNTTELHKRGLVTEYEKKRLYIVMHKECKIL